MVNKSKGEEDIYYAALKEPPNGRSAYIKAACGDNLELLEHVESLLKIRDEGNNFLESPLFIEQPLLNKLPEEQPGTIIDRYKLLEKIGEGGMAVVYMAEQEKPIRRKVALKIIKLGMDTKSVIARFEAERQALAMMDHPNIARVLDAGATETGRPYFVMELVTGVSITEYCDKNNLTTKERLALFIQVCNAVQHAHQKGIIHRDIKPTNVMVTRHEGEPIPKVIDFGIAKAIKQKLTEKTLFTRYAHIIGTPAYMSPEQADLGDMDVDTRSDIYSLGVLLYELLIGTTPFSEEELRKSGYLEMQRVIREQEPPKPSTKLSTLGETLTDIAKYRGCTPDLLTKAIRGDLDWIVMKTLEKARDRRYNNVSILVMDVQRHLDDQPILARAPSTIYRFRKFLRRHRSKAAALLVIALLLSVLTVISWLWSHAENQLSAEVSNNHKSILAQATHSATFDRLRTALLEVESILDSRYVGLEAQKLHDQILGSMREKVSYHTGRLEANSEDANSYFKRAEYLTYLNDLEKANADMSRYSATIGQVQNLYLEFDVPMNLGPAINTRLHEGSRVGLSPDGLSLVFSRVAMWGERDYEVLLSTRPTAGDPWNTPVSFGPVDVVSPSEPRGLFPYSAIQVCCAEFMTPDGLEVYFADARPGGHGASDIWMMRRETTSNDWGLPENLGSVVNSAYEESRAVVSPDGLELYFSGFSDRLARPGGCGHADLWITRRVTKDEPWAKPVNLGPDINSEEMDAAPYISADGLLLFFDSLRPGGYGSADLYVVRRASMSDLWGEAVNLGPVINTPATEELAQLSPDGSTLYWASNRPGGYGRHDIWQSRIVELKSLLKQNDEKTSTKERTMSGSRKEVLPTDSQ